MKPSAIHPVISTNSILGYFTAEHISDCKQRIIEIITQYYDVLHTCHLSCFDKQKMQVFDLRSTLAFRF